MSKVLCLLIGLLMMTGCGSRDPENRGTLVSITPSLLPTKELTPDQKRIDDLECLVEELFKQINNLQEINMIQDQQIRNLILNQKIML